MTRRGFVMPIVLMLSLAIGILAGMVLSRAGERATVVRDQLAGYRDSHHERGIKEIAAAWLAYSADQDAEDLAGGPNGGEAFTARINLDESVTFELRPAQATARINPIGLNVSDGLAARRVESILRERFGEQGLRTRTREYGPAAIDTERAPDDVVAALAETVLEDPRLATRFVSQLRQQDTTNGMDAATVRNAATAVGIEDEPADRLSMLFGVEPTLWRVRAVWQNRDPTAPAGRRRAVFEGVVQITPGTGFETQHANEMFLEWGRVDEAAGYTGSIGRPGA